MPVSVVTTKYDGTRAWKSVPRPLHSSNKPPKGKERVLLTPGARLLAAASARNGMAVDPRFPKPKPKPPKRRNSKGKELEIALPPHHPRAQLVKAEKLPDQGQFSIGMPIRDRITKKLPKIPADFWEADIASYREKKVDTWTGQLHSDLRDALREEHYVATVLRKRAIESWRMRHYLQARSSTYQSSCAQRTRRHCSCAGEASTSYL